MHLLLCIFHKLKLELISARGQAVIKGSWKKRRGYAKRDTTTTGRGKPFLFIQYFYLFQYYIIFPYLLFLLLVIL